MRKLNILVVLFLLSTSSVKAATLSNINQLIGGTVTYSGQESNLVITQVATGVYETKANSFACTPGTTGCEPDRYQIDFTRNIPHIYGLGMVSSANQVELNDFLDANFSSGHVDSPVDSYEGDIGRMRTPLFVIPSENLLVAYIQPSVKSLRLTRTTTSTQLILKKQATYIEGSPAPLLIIKANDPYQMYQLYYQYLKTHGFTFRQPGYTVFGMGWETFDEFNCTASYPDVINATAKFTQAGIPLDFAIIGSGYWNNDSFTGGCGTTGAPTTDTLSQSQTRFGQYGGLTQLINTLDSQGISLGLGMRLNVQTSNVTFMQNQFAAKGISSGVFLDNNIYYGNSPSNNAQILNILNPNIVDTFIGLTQTGYGPFKGIKEDEMFFGDQVHTGARGSLPNLPDGTVSKSYPRYYQKLGSDFFVIGRNDWFSVQADANTAQGWVKFAAPGWNGYSPLKPIVDSMLTQVSSGYPHMVAEPSINNPADYHNEALKDIPSNLTKQFLRTLALQTFFPVDLASRGFWHLTDPTYQNSAIFFAKLRTRLHQYAFDQTQKWYETGVPQLMQPLFIRFPTDTTIPTLYSSPVNTDDARDEYMFGNALLIRPIFSDSDTFQIYLPVGKWRTFIKAGPELTGGQYIPYTIASTNDFPVFLKESELLVIADPANSANLQSYVFFDGSTQSPEYDLYSNGKKYRLQAVSTNGVVTVKNMDSGQSVGTTPDSFGKGFQIANINSLLNASAGDFNADGKVDRGDLSTLFASWFTKYTALDAALVILNYSK